VAEHAAHMAALTKAPMCKTDESKRIRWGGISVRSAYLYHSEAATCNATKLARRPNFRWQPILGKTGS